MQGQIDVLVNKTMHYIQKPFRFVRYVVDFSQIVRFQQKMASPAKNAAFFV